MCTRIYLSALALMLFGTAHAMERYTEARITQVESSEAAVVLYLAVVSGHAPPIGNGGSNEPVSKPYLIVANSHTDLEGRKHMLATALLAYSQGAVVRFRWEDAGQNANRILVMLIRQ